MDKEVERGLAKAAAGKKDKEATEAALKGLKEMLEGMYELKIEEIEQRKKEKEWWKWNKILWLKLLILPYKTEVINRFTI